jgi:hypothetical protein
MIPNILIAWYFSGMSHRALLEAWYTYNITITMPKPHGFLGTSTTAEVTLKQ